MSDNTPNVNVNSNNPDETPEVEVRVPAFDKKTLKIIAASFVLGAATVGATFWSMRRNEDPDTEYIVLEPADESTESTD